jgi:vanillate O-demethylase ferredoxin subunit
MKIDDALTVRIASIRQETEDVRSFRLLRPNGAILPPFEPGSHIDVHLPSRLVRQYSLCNGPDGRTFYEIAVKREPKSRGGSEWMCSNLREGDLIKVGLPRNNFCLARDARFHLLMAAGIGITPLLSMARHLVVLRRPFELHYFVRSMDHAALLDRLAGGGFSGRVRIHSGIEPNALRAYVRTFLRRLELSHLYVCGPKPFMDGVKDVALPSWPAEAIHIESFSPDLEALTSPAKAFEVMLARSGRSYLVPEDKTITDVLREQGVMIPVSCEQGVCGTCLMNVVDGIPDHRDVYLTDEERASGTLITPCVSRAKSTRLVLDL